MTGSGTLDAATRGLADGPADPLGTVVDGGFHGLAMAAVGTGRHYVTVLRQPATQNLKKYTHAFDEATQILTITIA